MYQKTRGKKVLKEFTYKLYLRKNAVDEFYPRQDFLAVIYCALAHNEAEEIISDIDNIDFLLSKWRIPLSRDTIRWGFERLDAMNLVKWEN